MFQNKNLLKLILFSLFAIFIMNCASDPPRPNTKKSTPALPTVGEANEALARVTYSGGPNGYEPYTYAIDESQFNSWALTNLPTVVKYVDAFAKTADSKYILEIKGHADSARGRVSNSTLATRRAKSFYDRLIKAKVPKEKLKYVGASDKELIPGIESDARAQRRVTFKLIPKS